MIIALQMNSSNGLLSSPNRWKKWGMCPQPAASYLRIIFSLQLKIASNSLYANCISPLTFHTFLCYIISKIFFLFFKNCKCLIFMCDMHCVLWYECVCVCVFGVGGIEEFFKILFLIRIWIIYSFKCIDAMFFLWR